MIKFLAKHFISDYEELDNPRVQSEYIALSGFLGLGLNIFLFASKFIIGSLVNSISIVSDSFNNLSDSLTSLVAVVGAKASKKPADKDHPQGHGRLEYVASLIVAIIIILMSIQLFEEAIMEIKNPSPTILSLASVGVLVLSNLIKFYMYYYNHNMAKGLNSPLNEGVAKDSLNDTIATTVVLVTAIISHYTDLSLDGIAGFAIALLVFKTGLDFALSTVSILMGESASSDIENEIIMEIMKGRFIKGYHNLYIHNYGRGTSIAHVDVEVPSDISVKDMHDIINDIEERVEEKYGIKLVIHMDPSYSLKEFMDNGKTKVININQVEDREKIIDEAASLIKAGKLVVLPTETVYGLACDGLNEEAVDKLFEAKERPRTNPLNLHIADFDQVDDLVEEVPDGARKLMKKFWPGPLTLILKKKDLVPDIVTAGSDTVGLRMPANETFRAIARKVASPLACPSANISGRPSPTTVVDAFEDMKSRVDLIVGEGSSQLGLESTIIDMTGRPKVLRLGFYDLEDLKKLIPDLTYENEANSLYSKAHKKAHYKTKAKIIVYPASLDKGISLMQEDAKKLMDEGNKLAVLVSDESLVKMRFCKSFSYGSSSNTEEIARVLFSKLRDIDRLNMDYILVEGIEEKGKGLAIMNRLYEASGGNIRTN